jgi:molecular chaperone DnaK (HSP70)
MIAEAQSSAEADRRAKELLVQRARLEGLLRNAQRTFNEFGSSLSSGERAITQDSFAECEELLKSENVEAISEGTQKLERISQQLALAMLNPVVEHNGR